MIEIIGFGLAGASLSLRLRAHGIQVRIVDDRTPGSTVIAAGLVNPVAGKNFQPSVEVESYWKFAKKFYCDLDPSLFQELPIYRLWRDEKDRAKFEKKRGLVAPWIASVDDFGVTWKHGGWLNTERFLQVAREQLLADRVEFSETQDQSIPPNSRIWCTGARGLLAKEFPDIPHRSAKGEILTVYIPDWKENRILNRNGWLIPLGNDRYRVGATYEWDELNAHPTPEGRAKVESILKTFTSHPFIVEQHVAGIRPIIQRSQPVIHQDTHGWMFNGLGSKGVIYAPLTAEKLASKFLS